jgi:hypothetical protein
MNMLMPALLLTVAQAQTPAPADVDEVLRRYQDAIGGHERLMALKTLVKRGTYSYNGLDFPLRSYHARDGRKREEITGLDRWATQVHPDHQWVRAVDGDVAWVSGEERPARRRQLEGAAAQALIEEADFDGALIDARAKGHEVTLLAPGEVDGRPTLRLRVKLRSGNLQTWDLDATTYLPVRMQAEIGDVQGLDAMQVGRVWHYDDYRPVDGVLFPFWVHVEEMLFSREYRYDEMGSGLDS